MVTTVEALTCRLCGGAASLEYDGLLLDRYRVGYYRCRQCGSLQTEQPHWLNEAYAGSECSIDPGSARRVLDSYVLVHLVARLFGCRSLLDFGGNTGLLCRLLRDQGHQAYTYDRYVSPNYAPQFVGDPTRRHDLVSAFEVIEHFADPAQELAALFGAGPRLILVTTELYCRQGADWWYLASREGQHVFFYSAAAMQLVAARYGYRLLHGRGFLLFCQSPPGRLQSLAVRWLLRPRLLRLLAAWLLPRRGLGAQRDYDRLMDPTRNS